MAQAWQNRDAQKIRIPGFETIDTTFKTRQWHTITVKEAHSFSISSKREGAAVLPELLTEHDDVVEIELEDGSRFWTSRRRLCDEVLREATQRSADGTLTLTASLPQRGPSRGLIGNVLIKTLRFFKIDVPELAARNISAIYEKRTLSYGTGLYRCSITPAFSLNGPGSISTDRPTLLFLHGTASSTQGSFGALWTEERNSERDSMFAPYEGQVYAFEHPTLTESPITNAIALAKTLPTGAPLHLVSHSRGGMVGELLCRSNLADGGPPFDNADLKYFKKNDKGGHRGDLDELNAVLKAKKLRIERFVRVACPAMGTSLASERFDLYLSVIFNLLQNIPGLNAGFLGAVCDVFSELIMAIAKERSDPGVLPGLEAQIPGSPLVALLNRPDRKVAGKLRVIAGDIEGENIATSVSTFLTDPLYLGDHDLVVDTAAMFGGAEREGGSAFYFHQGSHVSHFRYFVNDDSIARLVKAISRREGQDDGFEEFSVRKSDAGVVSYQRAEAKPSPAVFILPGIMGSHLAVGTDRIWIDPMGLAFGGLSRLKIEAEGVRAEAPVSMAYEKLVQFLGHTHEVVPFPYDWRLSLLVEAQRLAEAIELKLDETEPRNHPVCIIAHSMGGLLARAMIATQPETWQRMCKHPDARLVMLGTPNGGSYIVPVVLIARESLVKQLALLDFTISEAEVLQILRFFPGLLEMMPAVDSTVDFFSPDTWSRLRALDERRRRWNVPDAALLEQARVFRNLIDNKPTIVPERMCYVAGWAPATPIGIVSTSDGDGNNRLVVQASPQGDGRVLWSTGQLPGVKTWYMRATHGDMADHEPDFTAILELVQKGTTDLLPPVAPSNRGVPEQFELPEEKTPLYPDAEILTRSALGAARKKVSKASRRRARVAVTHGNLAFARYPVMVGHYEGDTILSAELQLDRSLDGRLRDRLRLGLYPGAQDTELVFLPAASKHAGSIVIGLGMVGTLSPGNLARAVSRGARAYTVARAESRSANDKEVIKQQAANLSVLLIGTGAGGFSVEDSVAAILRGIAHANQSLDSTGYEENVRIDAVEFIELYEDRAIQAARALGRIRNDAELSRKFEIEATPVVVKRRGGRRRASFAEAEGWWQRLQITEDSQARLAFNLLTDRARTQAYLQPTQRVLVDQFIEAAMNTAATDCGIAITLFEMLVPNELKDRAPDQRDMVLVLNDAAARYPWELMQERRRSYDSGDTSGDKPLSVRAGMVRQLQSTEFREKVLFARGKFALVIGDPPSNLAPLPGALDEARAVAERLKEKFDITSVLRPDPPDNREVAGDILRRLYEREYRIVHLAGHGVYEHQVAVGGDGKDVKTKFSGMVIGSDKFLTPAEIRQMRVVPELVFINCCHLGRIEDKVRPENDLPRLAANLAGELIRMGVHAVVAAGWAVDDDAARTFAEVFYRELLAGVPFGRAVHRARKDTYEAYPGANTWGAYQCYGDPAFTLSGDRPSVNGRSDDLHFVAPAEAVVELENIAEDATTASATDIVRLTERVNEIKRALNDNLGLRGDIQAALGRALGELGFFDEAVEYYKKALTAEVAQVSVRAAEQLCNGQSRLAVAASKKNRNQAKRIMTQAKERLVALNKHFGPTTERLSLLGGIAKRKTLIAATLADKQAALIEMRNAYKKAHELKIKNDQQLDPYPLVNFLAADLFLGLHGRKALSSKEMSERVQDADTAATARGRRDPNFWDAVASVDCQLMNCLVKKNLSDNVDNLVSAYLGAKRRDASPREFSSVLDHLEFLSAATGLVKDRSNRNRISKALEEIRQGLISKTE
ncbi:MAG: CHAT domain-containing protein [Candidatus Binatia bacterium]